MHRMRCPQLAAAKSGHARCHHHPWTADDKAGGKKRDRRFRDGSRKEESEAVTKKSRKWQMLNLMKVEGHQIFSMCARFRRPVPFLSDMRTASQRAATYLIPTKAHLDRCNTSTKTLRAYQGRCVHHATNLGLRQERLQRQATAAASLSEPDQNRHV